jgi:exodeoxyribonuclease V beta subunit
VDPSGGAVLQVRFLARDDDHLGTRGDGKNLLTKSRANDVLPGEVASVAVDLLERGITIVEEPDTPRPLAPRDLAVLVRTNRRAYAVQRALRDAGVPAVIQRGGSVFMTEEADALQRLLDAMLRPNAERAAVTAAASVLFGRDAVTLVTQRSQADPAWDRWVDDLTAWGQRWQRSGILPALRQAFTDERVPERLLATPDGDRRLTNLRHLAELLHTAAVTDRLTPNALAEWLAGQRADAADGDQPGTETELRLEEDAEAVRVVTIHGSKGLQYPVVLCPDLWDGRVRVNTDLTRFHDPDVDDPLRAITLDLDVDTDAPGKQRAVDLAKAEERSEGLRLAYVALTRAQHRCVVWWGAINDSPTSALASLFHGVGDDADEDAPSAGDGNATPASG